MRSARPLTRQRATNSTTPASPADSACSNATPLAYLSYGLIGLGAAAVVVGAALLIVQPSESSDVAVGLLPEGGLSLRWAGNF